MEPLTAIAVIAARYGVAGLVGALTGDQSLGGLAAELVDALAESENRLAERLGNIEQQLVQVLEQPYSVAIGTGLRTLLDAGRTTNHEARNSDLRHARDLFLQAAASARTSLQAAVAERYLVLCAVGLGRQDAARTALEQLNVAAFEALLDAAERSAGLQAQAQARTQLERTSRFRREQRVTALAGAIVDAAAQAGRFAGHLLREAAVLAESLGDGSPPRLRVIAAESPPPDNATGPSGRPTTYSGHRVDRWEIRPQGTPSARFGPITVTWHSVQHHPSTTVVEVTVRADPVLTRPVRLRVEESPFSMPIITSFRLPGESLPAGQREIRFKRFIPSRSTDQPDPTLDVGGVLLFRPATAQHH